jgi:hypothetical protein
MRIGLVVAFALLTQVASGQAIRPTTAADSLALAVVTHTTAIDNALKLAREGWPLEVICLGAMHRRNGQVVGRGDTPAAILDALRKDQKLPLRPASACVYDQSITRGAPAVKDTTTGKPGLTVTVHDPEFNDDGTFVLRFMYSQGRFSAATWRCTGGKSATGAWIVNSCQLTGQS